MPYKQPPIAVEILDSAHRWESLRSHFWQRLNPQLSQECKTLAEGHFLRMQMEERRN